MPTENKIADPGFDLNTPDGGRGYIAHLFKTVLKRHDYRQYITERLAGDFACTLAQHFEDIKAREQDLQLRLNAADQRIDELTADRGELIGYQYRMRPLWRKDDKAGWMDWRPCFADVAADFDANPEDKDWQYQTRALYAGPAPVAIAEQS